MHRRLPPLNALNVFEVAARKLSFSLAAEELCVTQSAVSKQIKALEHHLQLTLFERTSSGLVLTPAGQQYLPTVMQALAQIQHATQRLQQGHDTPRDVTLSISTSLTSLWLIPRLDALETQFPQLRLHIVSGDGDYQFHPDSADLAIRCFPLNSRDIAPSHQDASLLLKETLIPLIHPDLLQRTPIHRAADLLQHELIRPTTRPQLWSQCLDALLNTTTSLSPTTSSALTPSTPAPRYHHAFEHFFMALEAAQRGQGVALIPDFLADEALAQGRLVNPLGLRYPSGYGYYFLMPAYRRQHALNQQLFDWFHQAFAAPLNMP